MDTIFSLYNQFLSNFPDKYHGLISLFLAILIVFSIFKVLKKDFIWLIVLIILLPASIPILKSIWDSIVEILHFLLTQGK